METRANHIVVGLFSVLILLAGLFFVYWLGRYDETENRTPYYIVFEGSVSGLSVGSSVLFNGIKVGSVDALQVDLNKPSSVRALINVEANTPVRQDTKVQLEYQGLTGVAQVQMTGGSGDARPLDNDGSDNIPVIIAENNQFQDLLEVGQEIMSKGTTLAARIDTILGDNQSSFKNIVSNIETFSQVLADNSDNVSSIIENSSQVAEQIGDFSKSIDKLIGSLDFSGEGGSLIDSITSTFQRLDKFLADNDQSLATTINNIESFTQALANKSGDVETFISETADLSKRLGEVSDKVSQLVDRANTIVDEDVGLIVSDARQVFSQVNSFVADNEKRIAKILDDASAVSESFAKNTGNIDQLFADGADIAKKLGAVAEKIDQFVAKADTALGENPQDLFSDISGTFSKVFEFVERNEEKFSNTLNNVDVFTTSVAKNADQIDSILKDAANFTANLDQVSEKLDELILQVDSMVDDDAKIFLQEAREAAQSINRLAGQIEKEFGTVSKGLSRLSGRGLREIESFVVEGRNTFRSFSRLIQKIERNPRQFLSGSSRTPEVRGQ